MKEKLRSQKLEERLQHNVVERKKKDFLIVQRMIQLPEFQTARNVLWYVPIQNEVDLTELFNLFKNQKKFILP